MNDNFFSTTSFRWSVTISRELNTWSEKVKSTLNYWVCQVSRRLVDHRGKYDAPHLSDHSVSSFSRFIPVEAERTFCKTGNFGLQQEKRHVNHLIDPSPKKGDELVSKHGTTINSSIHYGIFQFAISVWWLARTSDGGNNSGIEISFTHYFIKVEES